LCFTLSYIKILVQEYVPGSIQSLCFASVEDLRMESTFFHLIFLFSFLVFDGLGKIFLLADILILIQPKVTVAQITLFLAISSSKITVITRLP
jgi:hypothetical protein